MGKLYFFWQFVDNFSALLLRKIYKAFRDSSIAGAVVSDVLRNFLFKSTCQKTQTQFF